MSLPTQISLPAATDVAEKLLIVLDQIEGNIANTALAITTDAEVTAAQVLAAATAVAVATTAPTNSSPYGFSTSAQALAIVTAVNTLEADVEAMRQLLKTLVAALAAVGTVTAL